MKILHVIGSLSPSTGGPAEACLGLCKELARRGHDVSIYTTAFGQAGTGQAKDVGYPSAIPHYEDGVEIRMFPGRGFGRYLLSVPLLRALWERIPTVDIVHIHSIYLFHSTVGSYLSQRMGIPYIIKPHGTLDPYLRQRRRTMKWLHEMIVERQSFRCAGAIQFTAKEEMELAYNARDTRWSGRSANGFILPNGVEIPDASELNRKLSCCEDLLKDFPELRGKRIILFLGRINFKKGLNLLATAFGSLCRERTDVHLLIAGPDNDDHASSVRQWLQREGVIDRTTFAGMLRGERKKAAFQLAEMFVLPSYSENFGISIVEAMAHGIPVILSNNVNIWREIAAEKAGIVVPAEANAVADAMRLLLNDEHLRKELSVQGRELVSREFAWSMVGDKALALYERVMRDQKGEPPLAESVCAPGTSMDCSPENRPTLG